MERKDMDILIQCHEDAVEALHLKAVEIVEWCMRGRDICARQYREYNACKLAVESTKRDLENCMEIEAQIASIGDKN